jgi:hypothetical protein
MRLGEVHMRQTELLNMQDFISYESYDRWVTDNSKHTVYDPIHTYIYEVCEDNGYEPTGSDMDELRGELMFLIEQYSALLYRFYTHVGCTSAAEADIVHIMAGMQEEIREDEQPF